MTHALTTRRARRRRLEHLDPSRTGDLFALRDALVTDADAEVRATALLQLDALAARRLAVYARDATFDPSMRVREAAFVALARAHDDSALARARWACRHDRGYRVRRAAVLYAARTCGDDALALLAEASRDPFWRVRVTARRLGANLDAPVDTRAIDAPASPAGTLATLDDADPAVVAARLERVRSTAPIEELVGILGHSHHALRRLAVTELSARGDLATLRAVLAWLEDERIPYGPTAAEATLARSGSRAEALAARVLDEPGVPPALLAWGLRHAFAMPSWSRLLELSTHAHFAVRRAVAHRASEVAPDHAALLGVMTHLLLDADSETQWLSATWLSRSQSHSARTILAHTSAALQPSPVRALMVRARHALGERDALREMTGDAHGGVRAAAIAALVALGALEETERSRFLDDDDPWVVAAAGGQDSRVASASHARPATRELLALSRDADFGVRSAALHALNEHHDDVRALVQRQALTNEERIAAYTFLRSAGDAASAHETSADVVAHLALLDDAACGRVPQAAVVVASPRAAARTANHRVLGKTGISLQPLVISGAHGLSRDDFARAHDAGVNAFFWEPSHRELTRFLRMPHLDSHGSNTVVIAGTYHALARDMERDVMRTLRALRRETLDVFLAFWTRSTARLDEVTEVLRSFVQRGLVRAVGISTHDRALACDAADRGHDVVMVRHNAAHRGAEAAVFPHCAQRGTGVLTFSNLCYGRMLHRSPAALAAPVTAPDCYRYALAQPGVHASIAAPRRYRELVENLAVVHDAGMTPARMAELRAHGDFVYARSKAWAAETWSVGDAPHPRRETPSHAEPVVASQCSPVLLHELALCPRCSVAAESHRHSSHGRCAGRTAAIPRARPC